MIERLCFSDDRIKVTVKHKDDEVHLSDPYGTTLKLKSKPLNIDANQIVNVIHKCRPTENFYRGVYLVTMSFLTASRQIVNLNEDIITNLVFKLDPVFGTDTDSFEFEVKPDFLTNLTWLTDSKGNLPPEKFFIISQPGSDGNQWATFTAHVGLFDTGNSEVSKYVDVNQDGVIRRFVLRNLHHSTSLGLDAGWGFAAKEYNISDIFLDDITVLPAVVKGCRHGDYYFAFYPLFYKGPFSKELESVYGVTVKNYDNLNDVIGRFANRKPHENPGYLTITCGQPGEILEIFFDSGTRIESNPKELVRKDEILQHFFTTFRNHANTTQFDYPVLLLFRRLRNSQGLVCFHMDVYMDGDSEIIEPSED